MFERVYLGEGSQQEHRRASDTVELIFDHLQAHPELLPPGEGELAQRITDFLAGMTDRYALSYAAAL
jgi:dGTPase